MYKRFGDLREKLVFDIGANVGDYSKYFKEQGATVIAVEPQGELVFNNSNFSGVIVEYKCVADFVGEITLYECDVNTISTCSTDWKDKGRFSGSPWNKSRRVPCTTLDDMMARHGVPHAIKIDVEGFEDKVLDGLSCRVFCLVFEYTREFTDRAMRCLDTLQRLGFNSIHCYPMNKEKDEIAFGCDFDAVKSYLKGLPVGAMGDIFVS